MDVNTYSMFSVLFNKLTAKNIKKPEEILTHNLALWMKNMVLEGHKFVFFHVPNESFTSIPFSIKLNSMGRIPGAPDFCITSQKKSIFLELKAPDSSIRISGSQKAFKHWSAWAGIPYFITNSLEEAKDIIKGNIIYPQASEISAS